MDTKCQVKLDNGEIVNGVIRSWFDNGSGPCCVVHYEGGWGCFRRGQLVYKQMTLF